MTVTADQVPYVVVDDDDVEHAVLVTGLSPEDYVDLAEGHPPAPGDDGPWSEETFPPALLAACCDVDVETATTWWRDWPTEDVEGLLDLCLELSGIAELSRAVILLDTRPMLRSEVGYCAPAGVPHSHFLGGPPVWTRRDRMLALAWAARRAGACPGCSSPERLMRDASTVDIDLRRCEVCQLKRDVIAGIPEDERATIHAFVVESPDED